MHMHVHMHVVEACAPLQFAMGDPAVTISVWDGPGCINILPDVPGTRPGCSCTHICLNLTRHPGARLCQICQQDLPKRLPNLPGSRSVSGCTPGLYIPIAFPKKNGKGQKNDGERSEPSVFPTSRGGVLSGVPDGRQWCLSFSGPPTNADSLSGK